jgi:hypothetical protein
MQISDKFPQPKFQIGQRVRVKRNYTMVLQKEIYIVVQIHLSCITILTFPFEKTEPFNYTLLNEEDIGKHSSKRDLMWDIRESFIEGVE